jgi:hypothetical protein
MGQEGMQQLVFVDALTRTYWGRQHEERGQHWDEELARQRAHEHERGIPP